MELKDKHCICEKWREEYIKAFNNRNSIHYDNREVIQAQNRGELCPFCGKKLIDMKRKGFILIQFPPPLIDEPDEDRNNPEYYVSLEEFKKMLSEEE